MTTDNIKEAIANCDETAVMDFIDAMLAEGIDAAAILAACNAGMVQLGERFDQGEAFIPDLMIGGLIMKKAMAKLEPLLASGTEETVVKKTLVIGTVQHDVHDIGKDIAAMVFRSSGFNVIDLGVDVPAEKFIEAIREHKPDVVGMSLLLTTCYKSVMNTMQAIQDAGLRDSIKICVGGAAASELMAERAGIDFYAKTAVDGFRWASNL